MSGGQPIEKGTIKAIHTAKGVLALPEIVYRGMLQKKYRAHSSKALTEAQGKDLVKYLNDLKSSKNNAGLTCALCMPRTKRASIPADTIYPASPDQLARIEALKDLINWKHPDGYRRWLLKYFALAESEIIFSPQASVVINALQKLLRGQRKCSSCKKIRPNRGSNE